MFGECFVSATWCESWLAKFVILLFCASHFSVCEFTNTYFVVPTIDSVCLDEESHCMTLSEFNEISNGNFTSDTESDLTFLLLPGNHILDSNFTITNVSSLVIAGNDTDDSDETSVSCNAGVGFNFQDIVLIQLHGVTFSGCISTVTDVDDFTLDQSKLLGGSIGSRLEFSEVGSVSIDNCSFISNIHDYFLSVGGAIFTKRSNISISDCLFDNNYANYAGSSLYALNSSVEITDSTFSNNTSVFHGGAIEIDEESEIVINNCTFSENRIEQNEVGGIRVVGGGGISVLHGSSITVIDSRFVRNSANANITAGGAIYAALNSTVTISNSEFVENFAGNGGGAIALVFVCYATIVNSRIMNTTSAALIESTSREDRSGGAIGSLNSTLLVDNCEFINNVALKNAGGGAIGYALFGSVTVTNSLFVNNVAILGGAAIGTVQYTVSNIFNSTFINNTALQADGGAIACENCVITIEDSTFTNNSAFEGHTGSGGAIYFGCSLVSMKFCGGTITDCLFTGNNASIGGSALSIQSVEVLLNGTNTFIRNGVETTFSVVHVVDSTVVFDGDTTFSDNFGSIFTYGSEITFLGYLSVFRTVSVSNPRILIEPGGALTCFLSPIAFKGVIVFSQNVASFGAGILAMQCTLDVTGEMNVLNNVARVSGGGIYSYRSDIAFAGVANISSNRAQENGGGINAVNTDVILYDGTLSLIQNNAAQSGGGMYLESNSKLYVAKSIPECELNVTLCRVKQSEDRLTLQFIGNSADYGGAISVSDQTTPLICSSIRSEGETAFTSDCFFQSLVLYPTFTLPPGDVDVFYNQLNLLNTFFVNNSARESGHSIFGGLLDRCRVSRLAEVNLPLLVTQPRFVYAVDYLNVTTNVDVQDVSSDPVRVCFCVNNQPDCSSKPPAMLVRKGESFTLSLVAVDQVNHTVPSRIRAIPISPTNVLRGQRLQPSRNGCSELTYNVVAPVGVKNASMVVFADGPCQSDGISGATVNIDFMSCPVGFVDTDVGCDCDPVLVGNGFIKENCSIDIQSVLRRGNAWISYNLSEEGFLVSQNCPLDYCLSSSNSEELLINLNVPNGADVQCAFNRSGILCGQCADGLSLLLGSSHCGECSNHNGLALIIVFAIAGVLLVIFILVCNLTIAVGTINGLILYVNIVSTNSASFYPKGIHNNILTVFIAWLNLDFGFETCFFDGMDEYAKTWLQLAFPSYIIFLVILIIVVSEYSSRFSKLIANKHTVATLATLVLLSYTKFIRLIINVTSSATIVHLSIVEEGNDQQNGSNLLVWRSDGNVEYFEQKRLPLYVTFLVFGLLSIFFVFLLLFWQFLQRCPNKCLFAIISNPKLKSFMDAYHAPFKDHHRYWIGMQLLVRIILYIMIALNDNSAAVNSLWISIVAGTLLMLANLTNGGIYKKWPLHVLENSYLFNLLVFSIATIYVEGLSDNTDKVTASLAYISISIAFVTFVGTLVYHTCAFIFSDQINLLKKEIQHRSIKKSFQKQHAAPNPNLEQMLNNRPTTVAVSPRQNFADLRSPMRELLEIDPDTTSMTESDNVRISDPTPPLVVTPSSTPQIESRLATHTSFSFPYGERNFYTVR